MGDKNFEDTIGKDPKAPKRAQPAPVTEDELREFAGDDVEVIDLNKGRDRVQETTWWRL